MPLPTERDPLTAEQRIQLDHDLAWVEERLEGIAVLMSACYGDYSPPATRAGEVSAALQRLKWGAKTDGAEEASCGGYSVPATRTKSVN
jgi:hypothetical protein